MAWPISEGHVWTSVQTWRLCCMQATPRRASASRQAKSNRRAVHCCPDMLNIGSWTAAPRKAAQTPDKHGTRAPTQSQTHPSKATCYAAAAATSSGERPMRTPPLNLRPSPPLHCSLVGDIEALLALVFPTVGTHTKDTGPAGHAHFLRHVMLPTAASPVAIASTMPWATDVRLAAAVP